MTTAERKTRYYELNEILRGVYGTDWRHFTPTVVLWAADLLADAEGLDVAKAQLQAINRQRERWGLPVAVAAYGHRLLQQEDDGRAQGSRSVRGQGQLCDRDRPAGE